MSIHYGTLSPYSEVRGDPLQLQTADCEKMRYLTHNFEHSLGVTTPLSIPFVTLKEIRGNPLQLRTAGRKEMHYIATQYDRHHMSDSRLRGKTFPRAQRRSVRSRGINGREKERPSAANCKQMHYITMRHSWKQNAV